VEERKAWSHGVLGRQWQYPDAKAATSNEAGLVVSPPSCSLLDNDTTLPSSL